jgi:hypothetical protein
VHLSLQGTRPPVESVVEVVVGDVVVGVVVVVGEVVVVGDVVVGVVVVVGEVVVVGDVVVGVVVVVGEVSINGTSSEASSPVGVHPDLVVVEVAGAGAGVVEVGAAVEVSKNGTSSEASLPVGVQVWPFEELLNKRRTAQKRVASKK